MKSVAVLIAVSCTAFLGLVAFVPSVANASVITISFSGVVTENGLSGFPFSAPFPGVNVNDPFSGTIVYDQSPSNSVFQNDGTPLPSSAGANSGLYQFAPADAHYTLNVNAGAVTSTGTFDIGANIEVGDDFTNALDSTKNTDLFAALGREGTLVGFVVQLEKDATKPATSTAIQSVDLPTTLDLNAFDIRSLNFSRQKPNPADGTIDLRGTITNLTISVPEPSSLPLTAIGLAILAGIGTGARRMRSPK